MSRTEYYCAASLDGFIADPDDGIEWLTGYDGKYDGDDAVPMEGSYDAFYGGVGALVMGSATYEWILGHLAKTGGGWMYSGKPSWVLSSRGLKAPEGAEDEVHFASGPIADLAPEMLAAAGEKNLWIVGGGQLASDFAAEGLLDTVVLTVVPVILGAGKPLFGELLAGGSMQLAGTRAFDTGMVELRYELGG